MQDEEDSIISKKKNNSNSHQDNISNSNIEMNNIDEIDEEIIANDFEKNDGLVTHPDENDINSDFIRASHENISAAEQLLLTNTCTTQDTGRHHLLTEDDGQSSTCSDAGSDNNNTSRTVRFAAHTTASSSPSSGWMETIQDDSSSRIEEDNDDDQTKKHINSKKSKENEANHKQEHHQQQQKPQRVLHRSRSREYIDIRTGLLVSYKQPSVICLTDTCEPSSKRLGPLKGLRNALIVTGSQASSTASITNADNKKNNNIKTTTTTQQRLSDFKSNSNHKKPKRSSSSKNNYHRASARVFVVSSTKNQPGESGGGASISDIQQYRIRSRSGGAIESQNKNFILLFLSFKHYQTTFSNWLNDQLRWTFHAPFWLVLIFIFLYFVSIALLFAVVIYAIASVQEKCIYRGNTTSFILADKWLDTNDYVDAFQLSWTTLSTVGYGVIGPQAPTEKDHCMGINILMALESFVGVLFGSVSAAVFFGKIVRMQSVAHVQFSHPICVRYCPSKNNKPHLPSDQHQPIRKDSDDYDEIIMGDEEGNKTRFPCPTLEFRLINELSREIGGEILNASVSVVASTLAVADEDDVLKRSYRRSYTPKKNMVSAGVDIISAGAGMLTAGAGRAVEATTIVAENVFAAGKKVSDVTTTAISTGFEATATAAHNVVAVGKKVTTATTTAVTKTGAVVFDAAKSVATSGTPTHVTNTVRPFFGASKNVSTAGSVWQRTYRKISKTDYNFPREASSQYADADESIHDQAVVGDETTTDNDSFEGKLQLEIEVEFAAKLIESLEKQAEKREAVLDEGNEELAPPRVYHKLQIENDSHPFFKRVWNIRHTLNASSPLLSTTARRAIEDNDGYWPEEFNNYSSIREHLCFKQIIVSFSGIANASGNTVYTQKVYECDKNLVIGYSFSSVMVPHESDKMMVVDPGLLNDIHEQSGGGAEPWQDVLARQEHSRHGCRQQEEQKLDETTASKS